MSLRNRVRLVAIIPTMLWLIVGVWLFPLERVRSGWILLSALLAVLIGLGIANTMARRSFARFRKALACEDIPTARGEFAGLVDFWKLRGRETMKANGVSILMLEGRYEEALAELESLNLKRLGNKGAQVFSNHIAWCKAHLGEPADAIELSKSVLPQMEQMGSDYASSGHLVLGAATFLSGRAMEAMPHLEKAYALSADSASRKATAAFCLGESCSSLGKTSEAAKFYCASVDALPNGRFAALALDRLNGVSAINQKSYP